MFQGAVSTLEADRSAAGPTSFAIQSLTQPQSQPGAHSRSGHQDEARVRAAPPIMSNQAVLGALPTTQTSVKLLNQVDRNFGPLAVEGTAQHAATRAHALPGQHHLPKHGTAHAREADMATLDSAPRHDSQTVLGAQQREQSGSTQTGHALELQHMRVDGYQTPATKQGTATDRVEPMTHAHGARLRGSPQRTGGHELRGVPASVSARRRVW